MVDLSRFSGPETRLSRLHLPTVFVVVGAISLHATGFRAITYWLYPDGIRKPYDPSFDVELSDIL